MNFPHIRAQCPNVRPLFDSKKEAKIPDKPKIVVQIPALNKIHKYFNIKFYLYQENQQHHQEKSHFHFQFDKFQLRQPLI